MSFVYIFDLDQTLYPIGNSLFHQTSAYARAIITKVSGMEDETYYAMYQKYFAQRKDPFREMCKDYNIPVESFMNYHMHNDYSVLSPCTVTRSLLQKLSAKDKIIYTDSTIHHVNKALQALELEDVFSKIVDIYDMDLRAKGCLDSFDHILEKLDINGAECVMVEDSARNLVAAKNSGMRTVLITGGENTQNPAEKLAVNLVKEYDFVDEITPNLQDWLHTEVAKG